MKKIKECVICGIEFDLNSPEKRRAGGKINECHECADETEVKYIGAHFGEGKVAGCDVLKPSSKKDRDELKEVWRGAHTHSMKSMGHIKFKKIADFGGNPNHKGTKEK